MWRSGLQLLYQTELAERARLHGRNGVVAQVSVVCDLRTSIKYQLHKQARDFSDAVEISVRDVGDLVRAEVSVCDIGNEMGPDGLLQTARTGL